MKLNRSSVSSQLLILALAALVLMFMAQVARAQSRHTPSLARNSNLQGMNQSQSQNNQGNVIQIGMPQKSFGRRLLDRTSLTYYQQFLGPTASGPSTETYNVFQEGRAPLQSFHAANLRHELTPNWAIGATLSAVNGYTEEVQTKTGVNRPDAEFFNARAYLSLPSYKVSNLGTLFTTASYEAPTSSISRNDEMRYGWVLAQSFNFNLPNPHWSVGLSHQIYRIYYKSNIKAPQGPGFNYTALQTMIVSGGPYANYRFNDKWLFTSSVILDWDQKGPQTGSREWNNNLPHRGRVGFSYFPKIKYLSSVGMFTQSNLKFSPSTTAFGADFTVRF